VSAGKWCHWATISPNSLVNSAVKKFSGYFFFVIDVVNKKIIMLKNKKNPRCD
jgi:hypothetical protein